MIGTSEHPQSPRVPFSPDLIPAVLRERPQWVCWRYERRDGKRTKVPVTISTGARASSTDPATWGTFEDAVAALGRDDRLAGVGYVFAADDPYCGIDLDECIDEHGELHSAARELLETFNTYAEVSPSGAGVKLILAGTKGVPECTSRAINGIKKIEIYDRGRFFTITSDRLDQVSGAVEHRQGQLEALCARLWPPKPARVNPPAARLPMGEGDDEELLRRMFAAKNGDKTCRLYQGDTSMHGGDDSAADLALCTTLAFWCGGDEGRIDRLFRRSRLYREKWERQDYRERTIRTAVGSCTQCYEPAPRGQPPARRDITERDSADEAVEGDASDSADDGRSVILIDTDEFRVVGESVRALRRDEGVFCRGSMLVRILREQPQPQPQAQSQNEDVVNRPAGSPVIAALPPANLRERLTKQAVFLKRVKGELKAAHPPPWLVPAVHDRGEWPDLRRLTAVSDVPVLRPDGTVWQTPGYDDQTCVLYEPVGTFPAAVPESPSRDDAWAAAESLLEVVHDFHFESDDHRSAYMTALLTPMARHAFSGPAPLFLIDANIRGAGKGLLSQTIGRIALGRDMPVSSYSHDSEEMRKKITAIAIAADPVILLDNLEGTFGSDALDRALTATRWKDRILGSSQQVDLPLQTVWYGTGNNVMVGADTARRIVHIRLDVLEERPEERRGFRHPDLLAWVGAERPRLLAAGLTILSAYIRAGRPSQGLTPMGSFEGWSATVREAVVWAGLCDPCRARGELVSRSDTTRDVIAEVIAAWEAYVPDGEGLVIAEALAVLYPPDRQDWPMDRKSVVMRAALEALVGCPPGKAPGARQVGSRLKMFRRRVVGNVYLDSNPQEYNRGGAVWRLHRKGEGATEEGSASLRVCESDSSPYTREVVVNEK